MHVKDIRMRVGSSSLCNFTKTNIDLPEVQARNTHYPIQCLFWASKLTESKEIIHNFYPIFLGPLRKSVEHFSTDDKGHFFHKWTHKPFSLLHTNISI